MKKNPQRESAHVREYISIVAPSQHVTIAGGQIERHLNLTIMSADPLLTRLVNADEMLMTVTLYAC